MPAGARPATASHPGRRRVYHCEGCGFWRSGTKPCPTCALLAERYGEASAELASTPAELGASSAWTKSA